MQQVIKAFADKAELLAVEIPNLIRLGRKIEYWIATVISHQAAELALKAACLGIPFSIFKKGGSTISFNKALEVIGEQDILDTEEMILLEVLNNTRNDLQHSAVLGSEYPLEHLIFRSLETIDKVLTHIGHPSDELKLILEKGTQILQSNYRVDSLMKITWLGGDSE